jgi:uncharacterized membrane protein YdjX (TVP38/TMEM64 family)
LIDPEQPVNPEELLYHFLPSEKSGVMSKRIISWLAGIIVLLTIAGLWRFTELGQWIDINTITRSIETLRNYPFSVPLLIVGFIIGSILMVPVTMLIIGSVIVFGPWLGALYALIGAVVGAITTYLLGSIMGRDALKGLAGGRINRLSQKLGRHGLMTVTFVRIVPVAPFTIINLIAGASHIRLRDFAMGTVLGLVPGITGIAILTDRIQATMDNPDTTTILLLVLVIVLVLSIGYSISRYIKRQQAVL